LCAVSEYPAFRELFKTVVRIAANIADVRKNTGEPMLRLRAKVGGSPRFFTSATTSADSFIRDILTKKHHKKMPIPRKTVIEVVCEMTPEALRTLEAYERKGWRFERSTP